MTPGHILLVDDEHAGAEVLAQVLRDEGWTVTVAGNGRVGLQRLHEADPALVVTDYMMPVMNGAAMAHAIRRTEGYAGVRILLLSGVPEALLEGAAGAYDAYLRKPFAAEVFLQTVRRLMAG